MANYSSVVLGNVKFSVDFHRCGKCMIEYDSLEDFICHKITVEKCSIVLSESKKLIGIELKIPSFIDNNDTKNHLGEGAVRAEDKAVSDDGTTKMIIKKRRGRPRKSEKIITRLLESSLEPVSSDWKNCSSQLSSNLASFKNQNDEKCEREYCQQNSLKTFYEMGTKLPIHVNNSDLSSKLIITEFDSHHPPGKIESSNDCTCPKCGNKYKDAIVLKTHIRTVHCDTKPFKCKYDCSLSFKTKGSLMRHMRRHTGERPFRCKQCNRSFRESGALTRHLKSRFPCSTKSDNDLARYGKTVGINEYDSAKNTSTGHLPKSVSTLKVIITDISNQPKDIFPGGQDASSSSQIDCGLIINDVVTDKSSIGQNDEEKLGNSYENVNISSKFERKKDTLVGFSLNDCELNVDETSSKINSVSSSESRVCVLEAIPEASPNFNDELLNGSEELKCIACMENFISKMDLKNHLMVHVESLPFRCIHCCFICQSKQQLVKHQRREHGVLVESTVQKNSEDLVCTLSELEEEDNHIQDVVKQLFRTQNSIEAEELEFSGLIKKPAKHSSRCHICLKRFSCSLYLGCHMGIHTGEKPYICDICKKSFFLKDSLKKHSVCHSEERRYRCGECYKSFKRLSHARDHLRIHSPSYPYRCTKCGKEFRWQGTLKSHELSHGGPALRLHHCTTCERRFPSKWSLVRHQRLHSSETTSSAQAFLAKCGTSTAFSESEEKPSTSISNNKVINLEGDEFIEQKQSTITFEDQVASISVTPAGLTPPGHTYVLITQEDGSSCLVPTVAIVEELQEETSAVNNIEESQLKSNKSMENASMVTFEESFTVVNTNARKFCVKLVHSDWDQEPSLDKGDLALEMKLHLTTCVG